MWGGFLSSLLVRAGEEVQLGVQCLREEPNLFVKKVYIDALKATLDEFFEEDL